MVNRIYLIGMPGCGKSSTGKKLARQLQWEWIDLDQHIEEKAGMSIANIFEKEGEIAFRAIEQETLFHCNPSLPTIISCGGGTPAFGNNMEFINNNGLSVYLKANERFLCTRLAAKNSTRPLFKGLTAEDCSLKVTKLLSERKKFYEQAKLHIELPIRSINNLKNSILSHLAMQ